MKTIIAGSRSTTRKEFQEAIQSAEWINKTTTVISGTARGADTFGEEWAEKNGLEIERCPAQWNKFGKKAGPIRNKEMAYQGDALLAIWDGESRGTLNMINNAKRMGVDYLYI